MSIKNSSNSKDFYNARFSSLEEAVNCAIEKSIELKKPMYLISSSSLFYVNSSGDLLDWEKLYATYINGIKTQRTKA